MECLKNERKTIQKTVKKKKKKKKKNTKRGKKHECGEVLVDSNGYNFLSQFEKGVVLME